METPNITTKKVEYDQIVVSKDGYMPDVDDVINVLTVVTESEKELNYFDKPQATGYLKAAGLIEEPRPNMFKVKDREECLKLGDYLSNYVTSLIDHLHTLPDVMINSAHKEEDKK